MVHFGASKRSILRRGGARWILRVRNHNRPPLPVIILRLSNWNVTSVLLCRNSRIYISLATKIRGHSTGQHCVSKKDRKLIPVTGWDNYHPWPPIGGLSHLVFFEKANGFTHCVLRVGSRERGVIEMTICVHVGKTIWIPVEKAVANFSCYQKMVLLSARWSTCDDSGHGARQPSLYVRVLSGPVTHKRKVSSSGYCHTAESSNYNRIRDAIH